MKRPKSDWYSTCCSISLSNLQRIVGGYIETVTFPDLGGVVICNEEGRRASLLLHNPRRGFCRLRCCLLPGR